MIDEKRKIKVCVCIPSQGGMKEEMAMSLVGSALHSAKNDITIDIICSQLTGIARNRNSLVTAALSTGCDFILQIDNDLEFPPETLCRLVALDKDIMGVTYSKRDSSSTIIGRPIIPGFCSGITEFDRMPGGFMLVKSDVYRNIPAPWYFDSHRYEGAEIDQFAEVLRDSIGVTVPDDVMTELCSSNLLNEWLSKKTFNEFSMTYESSEDINFIRKARRYGYHAFCDIDMVHRFTHYGKHGFVAKPVENQP